MPPRISGVLVEPLVEVPVPFHVMVANSAAWVYRGGQGRVHCGAKPTRAGLWYAQHGLTVWFAFACDNHSGDLIAAVGWRVTGTP